MVLDRCPVCPVCDLGALWPNVWTQQDETWHVSRPRPHRIVSDGDPSPTERGTAIPTF